jgi:hypothetical protein
MTIQTFCDIEKQEIIRTNNYFSLSYDYGQQK